MHRSHSHLSHDVRLDLEGGRDIFAAAEKGGARWGRAGDDMARSPPAEPRASGSGSGSGSGDQQLRRAQLGKIHRCATQRPDEERRCLLPRPGGVVGGSSASDYLTFEPDRPPRPLANPLYTSPPPSTGFAPLGPAPLTPSTTLFSKHKSLDAVEDEEWFWLFWRRRRKMARLLLFAPALLLLLLLVTCSLASPWALPELVGRQLEAPPPNDFTDPTLPSDFTEYDAKTWTLGSRKYIPNAYQTQPYVANGYHGSRLTAEGVGYWVCQFIKPTSLNVVGKLRGTKLLM
jgi:hypothetical protein